MNQFSFLLFTSPLYRNSLHASFMMWGGVLVLYKSLYLPRAPRDRTKTPDAAHES